MALKEALISITRQAGADLSVTGQYRFVELSSTGQVSVCNAAGELAIGVLQNDPDAAGRAAEVAIFGQTKVILGATVAANAKVTTDNQGRAVTVASTNHVLGICVDGGAVGEIGTILLGLTPPILV